MNVLRDIVNHTLRELRIESHSNLNTLMRGYILVRDGFRAG
ncbi:hypothetical protein APHWI1_1235 [Anaplasma phagocytophilum str. ApWI1]|uniref:Uncharacterized protein n=1 Tax=Anaplasma phagocytophilum str. ApWI1 TaxID=1359155 RepID=A0A0F3PY93_ANAPH|nr:hypothetical protein [Anaplasma phagocytophilum]KJV85238.1 hypothetical protein APHWI1_1235 [Anaplasma phagocytophilum str. ApWI1]